MDNLRRNYLLGFFGITMFLVFTVLTLVIDVQTIGPEGTRIGFSSVNGEFHNLTGYNPLWLQVARYTEYIVFFAPVFFGILAILQLIVGKSIKKVDTDLYVMFCLYVILWLLNIIFEKVKISYGASLFGEERLKIAIYPAMYIVNCIVILGSAIMQFNNRIKSKNALFNVKVILWTIGIIAVLSEALSGIHWLTDLLGAVLLATPILILYYSINYHIKYNKLCKTIREQYKAE